MKANKTIKGYKAFNKDMTCRGKQYSENTEFVENVTLEPCESGMHFFKMPLDVLKYHDPFNAVFAPVEATGDIIEHDDKIVTNKLKIGSKMSLSELINAHFEFIKSERNSCTNGDDSHSCTNGNKSHSCTTGDWSHSSTNGYRSHSCTTGDNAIACSLGIKSRAMVVNGWLILVDWRFDKSASKWDINNIHSAKVGDEILGTKIEPNTWYWFEDGELKQELAEK